MGVIYILWERQLKRYWRSKERMIGSLGQPILFLLALGYGFGKMFQQAGGGNYIQFLAPGIIAMSILFTAMFSGIEIIWDRQFGFLKETLVAPVARWKIMFGRTLGGATVACLQGIVVLLISLLVGFRISNFLLLPAALFFMFLTAFLFTALGTALATKLEDMNAFPIIINFLIMPLFFLSGALFPLQGAPRGLQIIARLNPLSYGVDGLRGLLGANFHFGLGLDAIIMVLITALVFGIGSYLFTRIRI